MIYYCLVIESETRDSFTSKRSIATCLDKNTHKHLKVTNI